MSSVSNGEAFAALISRWRNQPSASASSSHPINTTEPTSKYPRSSSSNQPKPPHRGQYHPNQSYGHNQVSSSPSKYLPNTSTYVSHVHSPNSPGTSIPSSSHYDNDIDHSQVKLYESATESHKNIYYCEPCDKELPYSSYQAHLATHETCQHPNCTFSATKKVLSAHFHSCHGTYSGSGFQTIVVENQPFRVLLGSKPEEIEQWRAERRQKFPTASNMKSKADGNAAIVSAGGVIYDSSSSSNRNRDRSKKRARDHRHPRNNEMTDNLSTYGPKVVKMANDVQISFPSDMNEVQLLSTGIELNPYMYQQLVSPALFGPTVDINQSNDTNAISIAPAVTSISDPSGIENREICRNNLKGRCRHGNACRYLHADNVDNINNNKKRRQNNNNPSSSTSSTSNKPTSLDRMNNRPGKKQHGLFLPAPLTGGKHGSLLQHLLQDSIDEEQQLLLQSFRYIIEHNFFDEACG